MVERAATRAYPQTGIQHQVADLGVPYATEITISMGANVPGAVMHRVGTQTVEVTSVSTEPIPDSLFEIPAGYTVRKR